MKDLEQQLIDNENRVALMAAILLAGITARGYPSPKDDVDWAIRTALAITKEVAKEAEKVRGEL